MRTRIPGRNGSVQPWDLASGLIALAAVLIAFALAASWGTLDPTALGLVTLATAAGLAAARHHLGGGGAQRRATALVPLSLGLVLALAHDVAYLPGVDVDPSRLGAFRPTLALVAVLLATHFWRSAPVWFQRVRFAGVTLGGVVLGGLVIRASPEPGIDVWQSQQSGALALLSGLNPYRLTYFNVYGPGTPLIDPRLLSPDGQYVLAFPYPPLSLILDVPSAWLGDIRWTLLLAVAAAAVLIQRLGRGSLESELSAAFLLLQPRAFFQLEMAWTEPVVLAFFLAAVLAVDRSAHAEATAAPRGCWRIWLLPGLTIGLAISSKQYAVALLIPLLLAIDSRVRRRVLSIAASVATVIALPFLVAGPTAFVRGVVEFQFLQPFREDALSWPAQLAALGGPRLPSWPAFLLAGATYLVTVRRAIAPAQAVLAAASFWLVFVLFNKQAFCNYYWLAIGLLCATVALMTARHPCEAGTEAGAVTAAGAC